MQSQNEYIGDDNFQKFLQHYNCPTTIDVVKMKFAGAICSPNIDIRPTDVISSLWEESAQPRLETKKEAELFFKFFMGLWDDVFNKIRLNKMDVSGTYLTTYNYRQAKGGWCQNATLQQNITLNPGEAFCINNTSGVEIQLRYKSPIVK